MCLFIDFEKAFDSVWKKGLMTKLYDAGVTGKIWTLINDFLFCRKVRLIFNNYTGIVRACREFGLPQGSALSPILFKFYVHDFANNSAKRPDVSLYKFADDGTLKVASDTTLNCLQVLQYVCNDVYLWSTKWRMVINCDVSKTEIICFGTAEKDESLLPDSMALGNNSIKFVKKTKVLGLVMDKGLSYVDHGKMINNKILYRWVSICKYSNRNWGFRQHVIVRLLEVIMGTCVCYAGIIWFNRRSLSEVAGTWYKVLKSATGAIFNIQQSTAEALLGVPPLAIQNRINTVKHFLKLVILSPPKDPLKDALQEQLSEKTYCPVTSKVKDVFHFLKWKQTRLASHFSHTDWNIINSNQFSLFGQLSTKSCSYSKPLMKQYTESVWQGLINNQCQLEGWSAAPQVSLSKLVFPKYSSREVETLTLSLFYPNNLLLSFLNNYDSIRFPSSACPCGNGLQDASHILLHCLMINNSHHLKFETFFKENPFHPVELLSDQKNLLLSWIRLPGFVEACCTAMRQLQSKLITEITLS